MGGFANLGLENRIRLVLSKKVIAFLLAAGIGQCEIEPFSPVSGAERD